MGILAKVLVVMCPLVGPGVVGDECEDVEVRAATCQEGVVWARGWLPRGWVVVNVECREERRAEMRQK